MRQRPSRSVTLKPLSTRVVASIRVAAADRRATDRTKGSSAGRLKQRRQAKAVPAG